LIKVSGIPSFSDNPADHYWINYDNQQSKDAKSALNYFTVVLKTKA
jgi:hypothetical protein